MHEYLREEKLIEYVLECATTLFEIAPYLQWDAEVVSAALNMLDLLKRALDDEMHD